MTTRRAFLQAAGIGLLTPFVVSAAGRRTKTRGHSTADAGAVFPQSVASGDPSPSGVVLWTRVDPAAWSAATPLRFEVATDDGFRRVKLAGEVAPQDFAAARDFTVHLDLDGHLDAGRVYFYRFLHGSTASRTGRCRTLPRPGASPASLNLGVLTCQDYTNGYYGALAQLAVEPVDFVLHLGDFIYETVGDPDFQMLPYPDRRLELPSQQPAATGLADFRFLYRIYRSDPLLQRVMEAHTFICLWDDHETANDCYWDYARDTLGAPDHPFTTQHPDGGDPAILRQLKLDAQRAWTEYIPARVPFNAAATHPFAALQIYRKFAFGDLAELFVTDQRTYRTGPPCGLEERNLTRGCDEQLSPMQSMLGETQRSWFVNGVTNSAALWKVWGNETFLGQLKIGRRDGRKFYLAVDAWDGYEADRIGILSQLQQAGVRNFLALTGDLHTFMAAYLKVDYGQRGNQPGPNLVGVEFMTPAVTSSTLVDYLKGLLPSAEFEDLRREEAREPSRFLFENLARKTNPHIHFFNSQAWGYSIVEFTREHATYSAYSVDKSTNAATAAKRLIRQIRVPVNRIEFVDLV